VRNRVGNCDHPPESAQQSGFYSVTSQRGKCSIATIMPKKSSEPKTTFREQMEAWLRKTIFPKRDIEYMNEADSTLIHIVDSQSPSVSPQYAKAKA
jgi:hypothetical protein